MAKELRAVEDVRPPHKVTDYSSSSEESGTTDEEEEDVEQEGADDSTSGPEDTRAALVLAGLEARVFLLGLLSAQPAPALWQKSNGMFMNSVAYSFYLHTPHTQHHTTYTHTHQCLPTISQYVSFPFKGFSKRDVSVWHDIIRHNNSF